MRVINRLKSLLDFNEAVDLITAGKYSEAESLLRGAIDRSQDDVIHVHVLLVKVLANAGDAEATAAEHQTVMKLLKEKNFDSITANYVAYCMAIAMDDWMIDRISVPDLLDPEALGLDKVAKPYARIFPYIEPRPRVRKLFSHANDPALGHGG